MIGQYTCGLTNQGISVGYTDIYYHTVEGMEILIPEGTCNGEYKVVVQIDPNNNFLESNENNNVVVATLNLTEQSDKQKDALNLQGSTTLCKGETAVLSTNYGDSFLWSSGETTQSITIELPGSYSCRIETACGYIYSDTIQFDYDTIPVPSLPNSISLCNLSDSIYFTSSANGLLSCFTDSLANNMIAQDDTLFISSIPDSLSAIYIREEVVLLGDSFSVGMPDNLGGQTAINSPLNNGELQFDVQEPFTLLSVKTYADVAGERIFQLYDAQYNLIYETPVYVNSGEDVVELNYDIDLGAGFRLRTKTHPGFYRNRNNVVYPYEVPGIVSITGTNYGPVYYYYFYDWKIKLPDRNCESELKKIEILDGSPQQAQILNLPSIVNINNSISLNAIPAGGSFSNNVTNGILQANSLAKGLNFITYSVTALDSACSTSVTQPIMVVDRTDNYGLNVGNTIDP